MEGSIINMQTGCGRNLEENRAGRWLMVTGSQKKTGLLNMPPSGTQGNSFTVDQSCLHHFSRVVWTYCDSLGRCTHGKHTTKYSNEKQESLQFRHKPVNLKSQIKKTQMFCIYQITWINQCANATFSEHIKLTSVIQTKQMLSGNDFPPNLWSNQIHLYFLTGFLSPFNSKNSADRNQVWSEKNKVVYAFVRLEDWWAHRRHRLVV